MGWMSMQYQVRIVGKVTMKSTMESNDKNARTRIEPEQREGDQKQTKHDRQGSGPEPEQILTRE